MSKEKQIEEMAKVMANGRFVEPNEIQIGLFIGEAETLYNAGYRKQSELTPCDCCKFNPPSSTDGKPCIICPASAKMKDGDI